MNEVRKMANVKNVAADQNIKFSFESPIELLERSKLYNDYEYALVHLFDKHPEYLKFYEEQILKRPMYLDNSAYELGSSFDPKEFEKWVEHFADINAENLYYFLPDYPGDGDKTVEAAKAFPRFEGAKAIGVLHGSTFGEVLENAKRMVPLCDMFAIPMLKDGFNGDSNYKGLEGRTKARQKLVDELDTQMRFFAEVKPIHLLGCLLPQEFKDYPAGMVYSADTSNPILHGIEGILYNEDGLKTKSKLRMDENISIAIHPQMNYNIFYNIKKFYQINGIFK